MREQERNKGIPKWMANGDGMVAFMAMVQD